MVAELTDSALSDFDFGSIKYSFTSCSAVHRKVFDCSTGARTYKITLVVTRTARRTCTCGRQENMLIDDDHKARVQSTSMLDSTVSKELVEYRVSWSRRALSSR